MDIEEYKTANSWFAAMHGLGYSVPVIVCQAIEKIMKDKKVTFPEAYNQLKSQRRIKIKGKIISLVPLS